MSAATHTRTGSRNAIGVAPLLGESPSLNDPLGLEKPKPAGLCNGDSIGAVLTLVNSALGAGVLAYPFAFMNAGMAMASLETFILGLLSYTALISIMHCMKSAQEADPACRSYGDLITFGLGKRVAKFVEGLIVVYAFGSCVGYLILLGDMLQPLLSANSSLDKPTSRLVVTCAACVGCFLLCLLRRITALKYSAGAAVAATFFTVGLLVYQAKAHPCQPGHCADERGSCDPSVHDGCDPHHPARDGWPVPGPPGVYSWPVAAADMMRSLPLIAFALQCHIQCAMVYSELPSAIGRAASSRRSIAFGAVALVLVLYFPTGIAGFLRFGLATQGDILQNFDVADEFADVARVCVALTALCAFPMQHFPARAAMHNWCANSASRISGSLSMRFVFVEASVWSLLVLGTAIAAGSSLALVFQLIGAVCASTVILILPGVLWARLGTGSASSCKRVLPAAAMIVVGVFILITGTGVTVEQMMSQSQPKNLTLGSPDGSSPWISSRMP